MEIAAIILVAWLVVAVGVVSLCWAAARGDEVQVVPSNRRPRPQPRYAPRPARAPDGARTASRI